MGFDINQNKLPCCAINSNFLDFDNTFKNKRLPKGKSISFSRSESIPEDLLGGAVEL